MKDGFTRVEEGVKLFFESIILFTASMYGFFGALTLGYYLF